MTSTVPAKSNNPLHNFDLPYLKWKKNQHSNNHHRRRSNKISSDSSSHHSPQPHSPMRESLAPPRYSDSARQSPMRDLVPMRESSSPMRESITAFRQSSMRDPRQSPMRCESVPESDKDTTVIEYRRHSRISAPESTKKGICDKSDKKHKAIEVDAAANKEGRSKILLKIPRKNKAEEKGDESQEEEKGVTADEEATEESAPKTWNLRPRKPIHRSLNLNGGPFRAGGSVMQENNSQSPHMNVNKPENNESNAPQKKEKRLRFEIALSREEIDEDIYALTGSKASRRPKKRGKSVQKQLDTLFPGLWLASITPDSYKVCENVPKG